MAKNLCPFDWEHGACREHDCALYVETHWTNPEGAERRDWSCVFVASLRLQANACYELGRAQASNDKVTNAVQNGFGSLLALAGGVRPELTNGK